MSEIFFVVGAKPTVSEQFSLYCENNDKKTFYLKDGAENGWNKASPISARTNLLQVQDLFGEINKAFIIFDSRDFIKYSDFDVESISKSYDSMVLGYSYIVTELLKTFYDQNQGELVFIFSDDETREKSILENVGANAFSALAESIAQKKANKQLGITLIKTDSESLENNLDWLFSYLENTNSKKAATMPKHACRWIKWGSKTPMIFPFTK
jgi:hypothetical protein